jgi:hypothetical protein
MYCNEVKMAEEKTFQQTGFVLPDSRLQTPDSDLISKLNKPLQTVPAPLKVCL